MRRRGWTTGATDAWAAGRAVGAVGDGEFETGPLAASWHGNKFVDPVNDGAVLPILALNGWKIANPTIPARIPREELESLLRGYGHHVITVEGDDPTDVHRQMAAALDEAHDMIRETWRAAREDGDLERRPWPMILLVTPKGWTGPAEVDGKPVEGTWRAHQVPLAGTRDNDEHRAQLEEWLRSYAPGRALRRRRPTGGGGAPAGAGGHPADERQPARQRRPAQAAAAPARLARERRRGGASGRVHPRADPRAGPVARRRGP